jgi:regulator of sigma E protease
MNKKWISVASFFAAVIILFVYYPLAFEVIVGMGLVITVHELGHFFMAKASGIRVEVLSLGFGSPLLSIERGGTRYQIAPIPLGGYMKPAGEFEEKEENQGKHAPDEFLGKPWYVRGAVLLAGPIMNFIAPTVFLFVLYATIGRPFFIAPPLVTQIGQGSGAEDAGVKVDDQIIKIDGQWADDAETLVALVDSSARKHPGKKTQLVLLRAGKQINIDVLSHLDPVSGRYRLGVVIKPGPEPQRRVVERVLASTPAEKAGFKSGDTILSVNGKLLKQGEDFPLIFYTASKAGPAVAVELARAGSTLTLQVPSEQPIPSSIDPKLVGVLGLEFEANKDLISSSQKQYERLQPWEAAKVATLEVAFRVTLMVEGIADIFAGRVKLKDSVSGPVAIARMAHQEAKSGLLDLLLFMVNISLILGVMNLLPMPLLDGGTFVLCVIEGLRGKPMTVKAQTVLQNVSGGLLIALVLFATYNDLGSVFGTFLHK